MNLVASEETLDIDQDEEGESKLLRSKRKCLKCGTPMTSYLIDEARKLHVCGNNPDCPGFALEDGQFRIKGYDGPVLECDKCGAGMQLKSGRFGKYFGCTSCANTRKLLRSGQPAPPTADPISMPELHCEKHPDDHFLLRDGASGLFLAASRFPKNRETRAPLVRELLPHANELDPKFRHLLTAPAKDADGVDAVIRFSRKTREHYVQAEVGGKATGWRAFYRKGEWVEQAKPAVRSRKSVRKKKTGRKAVQGAQEELTGLRPSPTRERRPGRHLTHLTALSANKNSSRTGARPNGFRNGAECRRSTLRSRRTVPAGPLLWAHGRRFPAAGAPGPGCGCAGSV